MIRRFLLAGLCALAFSSCAGGASVGSNPIALPTPGSSASAPGASPTPGVKGTPGTTASPLATASATATPGTSADLLETGLQGEVPLTDQASGRSLRGYHRGLQLIGQNTINNRGANLQLAWAGNCAYVGQAQASRILPGVDTTPPTYPTGEVASYGIAVLDVTDDTKPTLLHVLQSPATYDTWEALHTNAARNFLAVSGTSNKLDLYDITDCKNPTLISDITTTVTSHGMIISPDGNTIYIADNDDGEIQVIDVSNLQAPKIMMTFTQVVHDLDIKEDGTRLYVAAPAGGVYIYDVSGIQNRASPATPKIVSQFTWPQFSHTTRLMHNGGRTYLMDSDEVNATGDDRFGNNFPVALSAASDAAGSCPWGWGRIIDITNETSPVLASTFGLQVNDAANCTTTVKDVESPSYQLVNYSSHYGGFDNQQNAKMAFWTWYASGLRVFDIGNPASPVEIAYYNPPPIATVTNNEFILGPSPVLYDYSTSYTHYNPSNGDIWFVSEQNGFQIVRLTKTAGPMTYPQDRRRGRPTR